MIVANYATYKHLKVRAGLDPRLFAWDAGGDAIIEKVLRGCRADVRRLCYRRYVHRLAGRVL